LSFQQTSWHDPYDAVSCCSECERLPKPCPSDLHTSKLVFERHEVVCQNFLITHALRTSDEFVRQVSSDSVYADILAKGLEEALLALSLFFGAIIFLF
jgi:hypothetical protein